MSETVAIETIDIGKRYGSHWALQHCSLQIPAGTVTALVGPNGAGKTTLLHLLVGLIAPTAGSARVLGCEPYRQQLQVLPSIGFVGQDHPMEPGFSTEEMLTMGRKLNSNWDQHLAERWLAERAIPLDRKANALSGGQQAQVALAMALAKRPKVLILDEPAAALDPLARREFLQSLMTAVAETNMTVLLSSHIIGDLERVCDYMVLVAQGEVQLSADLETIDATHFRLVGPADAVLSERPELVVLRETTAGRQRVMIVRTPTPFFDAHWQISPLSLEDIVLSYLSRDRELEFAA